MKKNYSFIPANVVWLFLGFVKCTLWSDLLWPVTNVVNWNTFGWSRYLYHTTCFYSQITRNWPCIEMLILLLLWINCATMDDIGRTSHIAGTLISRKLSPCSSSLAIRNLKMTISLVWTETDMSIPNCCCFKNVCLNWIFDNAILLKH